MKRKVKVISLGILLLLMTGFLYADVTAQYKCGQSNTTTLQIQPHFRIVNTGTDSIPLEELTLRYYFTSEGSSGDIFSMDYAVVGTGNISGTFGSGYVEIGFSAGAGSLGAGNDSGEIQARIHKADWSLYDQSDDISFGPDITTYQDWDKVTLFRSGTQIWPETTETPTPTGPPNETPTAVPQGEYSINVTLDTPTSALYALPVKYFGDYSGFAETNFTIGPYPEPFEVYIETMVLDAVNGNNELYHSQARDNIKSNYGIIKTTADVESAHKTVSLEYDFYIPPTPVPTFAPTCPPWIDFNGRVYDRNTEEAIEGAEVVISYINSSEIIDTFITDSDGEFMGGCGGTFMDVLATVNAPGYHTAEGYYFIRNCVSTNEILIECVPDSETGPTPLPVYSPAPNPTYAPMYTPVPWTKVAETEMEIIDTHYPSGSYIHVRFPVDTPNIRVEDWGEPYRDGSVFIVDVKVTKWWPLQGIPENNTLCHTYDLGVLPAGDSFTFVVKEYGGIVAQKDVVVEPSPWGTLMPGEMVDNTTYEVNIIEQGDACFADVTAIFIEGEGLIYEALWGDMWDPLQQDGNTFSISTNFVRYKLITVVDTSVTRYSKRYYLGELLDGESYTLELYAGNHYTGDTLVKTVDFTFRGNTTPTPTPPPNSGGCVWMVPQSGGIETGDLFTIDIHANAGYQQLTGFGLDLSWSDLSIEYVGYIDIDRNGSITYVEEWPEYGMLSIAAEDSFNDGMSEDMVIVRLLFKAVAASSPTINLGINNLLATTHETVGIPVGDTIQLTITGEGTPAPTIDATPVPTATPVTVSPQPSPNGNLFIAKEYFVYDSSLPGNPPVTGALVRTEGLTANRGYTNEYGYCKLYNYANEAQTVNVAITADGFLDDSIQFSPPETQPLYEIGLLPDGTSTDPPPTDTPDPAITPTPIVTTTPSPPPCDITVEGTILDSITNNPVKDAVIILSSDIQGDVSTTSDYAGYFSLSTTSASGSAELTVYADGYNTYIATVYCGTNANTITLDPSDTGAGTVWIEPASYAAVPGTSFELEIRINTGTQKVAAYGLVLYFDSLIVTPDPATFPDPVIGGADGFLTAVNYGIEGQLRISGFDTNGAGPGSDIHFLTTFWTAGTTGETDITLTVDELVNRDAETIGNPNGIGAHITIADFLLGDVNHNDAVDIVDALLIAQYYVELDPDNFYPSEGDVNCDGDTNIIDALLIAQHYVGLDIEFCS
ncbi:MAG: carboxypeptidase regulatory-like domain-containing protein [Spirochaetales bacterium]|nr:carboxypeptidase regulatory-like domain-containing protein [Spirochaetales bacterium]